jgi:cytochrome c oxidase assembly protein subunit 15
VQYFTDLPILLVLLHMLGAVLIAAFTARLVWAVRGPITSSSYRTTPRPDAVSQLN